MMHDILDSLGSLRPRRHPVLAILVLTITIGGGAHVAWAQCSERDKLLASDGAASDQFGQSVAVSGNVALVGMRLDDDNGTSSGSAYVFRFNGSTWVEELKLLPTDGTAGDRFGVSVAVSGDVAVIGASLHGDNGTNSGAAYVFRFNGSSWIQEQKLLASDGAVDDAFGTAVAVSGNVIAVGAYSDDGPVLFSNFGSAYMFRFNGIQWIQEQQLLASDGARSDEFAKSVALSGDVAIFGARGDDDNGGASGSAYAFRFNGSSWIQEQKLLPSDGAIDDRFGVSVSVSGDVVAVGAYRDDDNGGMSGSAYVFAFNGSTWVQEQKLLPSDGFEFDKFGYSVSVSGDVVAVGAFQDDDNGLDSGSAYIFLFDGSSWSQEAKLLSADGAASDFFGYSVGVSGDVATVGAYWNDDSGLNSGSAYMFSCASVPSGCTFDSDCDDSDDCTMDLCNSDVCSNTPIQCPEGQQCNPQTGECEQASVCNQNCVWDTNGDSEVDAADLADLLLCWGQITGEMPVCECIDDSPSGGDRQIRADDLAVMLVVWGTCPD